MKSNQWIQLLMAIGEATINFFKALLGMTTKSQDTSANTYDTSGPPALWRSQAHVAGGYTQETATQHENQPYNNLWIQITTDDLQSG